MTPEELRRRIERLRTEVSACRGHLASLRDTSPGELAPFEELVSTLSSLEKNAAASISIIRSAIERDV